MDDIISKITLYYGVDWVAMGSTILSIYYLGSKKRIGFIWGGVAAISWLVFAGLVTSLASVIANIIFLMLNIRGYIHWIKEKN